MESSAGLLVEVDVGERADREGDAGHGEDEDAADGAGAVELALAVDGHEADGELRLGEDADSDAEDEAGDDGPPHGAAGNRHLAEADDAAGFEFLGDEAGEVAKRLVRGYPASGGVIGEEEEDDHSDEHEGALERVGVHDALESAGDDVEGDYHGEDEDGDVDLDAEVGSEELGAAEKDAGGVDRHKEEYDEPGEDLDKPGVVTLAHELRERMRAELVAHAAGGAAEDGERDEDADEDVEEGQPQQRHAHHSGKTAEADDGRGGDESRAVGKSHDEWMGVAAGDEKLFGGLGPAPAEPAEIAGDKEVDDEGDDFEKRDVRRRRGRGRSGRRGRHRWSRRHGGGFGSGRSGGSDGVRSGRRGSRGHGDLRRTRRRKAPAPEFQV